MRTLPIVSRVLVLLLWMNVVVTNDAQAQTSYPYEPSTAHPFGLPNPAAPAQLLDWQPLIGTCDCQSVSRIDKDHWADTIPMTWTFKYIMNGWAVQDETLKADGKQSGSIRQYDADSARWYVHYYNSGKPAAVLPAWHGGKTPNGDIVLYRDQKAPNGSPGFYRIIFSDITQDGFNWQGAWISKDESFVYPSWKIFCRKKTQP